MQLSFLVDVRKWHHAVGTSYKVTAPSYAAAALEGRTQFLRDNKCRRGWLFVEVTQADLAPGQTSQEARFRVRAIGAPELGLCGVAAHRGKDFKC